MSDERLLLSEKYKAFLKWDGPVEFLEVTTAAGTRRNGRRPWITVTWEEYVGGANELYIRGANKAGFVGESYISFETAQITINYGTVGGGYNQGLVFWGGYGAGSYWTDQGADGEVQHLCRSCNTAPWCDREVVPILMFIITHSTPGMILKQRCLQDPVFKSGWIEEDCGWRFCLGADGAMVKGLQSSGGKWYYLDQDGALQYPGLDE